MPSILSVPRPRSRMALHTSAREFLVATFPTLMRLEESSNIILAHALKLLALEEVSIDELHEGVGEGGASHVSTSDFPMHRLPPGSCFWLTSWSPSSETTSPELQLVMSCLDWTLGDYPVFVWSPLRPVSLMPTWLGPRMMELAEFLLHCVAPERVFSVFGSTPLVKAFACHWTTLTGFAVESEPFYSALFTHCTAETLLEGVVTVLPEGHQLRQAVPSDNEAVAALCKEFADESVSCEVMKANLNH